MIYIHVSITVLAYADTNDMRMAKFNCTFIGAVNIVRLFRISVMCSNNSQIDFVYAFLHDMVSIIRIRTRE